MWPILAKWLDCLSMSPRPDSGCLNSRRRLGIIFHYLSYILRNFHGRKEMKQVFRQTGTARISCLHFSHSSTSLIIETSWHALKAVCFPIQQSLRYCLHLLSPAPQWGQGRGSWWWIKGVAGKKCLKGMVKFQKPDVLLVEVWCAGRKLPANPKHTHANRHFVSSSFSPFLQGEVFRGRSVLCQRILEKHWLKQKVKELFKWWIFLKKKKNF